MTGPHDPADGSQRLFLAERYISAGSSAAALEDAIEARAATAALTREGTPIRFLGSTLVPADETCFSLFEASDLDAVRSLAARASIAFHRINEAVRISGIDA